MTACSASAEDQSQAVPRPKMGRLRAGSSALRMWTRSGPVAVVRAVAGNAEQHPHRGHYHDQRRTAVAQKRQGYACQRDRSGYAADVDQRLV